MMAIDFLMRIFAKIPKWLLVSLAAIYCAYMLGISHGRAPYKLAAKLHEAKAKTIAKRTTKQHHKIDQKGKQADEALKNYDWVFDDVAARRLRDILQP